MRSGTLQQVSPLFITSFVARAGEMNGSLFYLHRTDRQLVPRESREAEGSLSGCLSGIQSPTDASSDILDVFKVWHAQSSAAVQKGVIANITFSYLPTPRKSLKNYISQITPDISSDQPPVTLMALGHVVRCWQEHIPKTKSHTG